jgi:hypothetical protein
MPRLTFRSILFLLLAALSLAAPRAAAQDDVLRQRDLRGSTAPRLYDAIAQLRPGWLQLAGGPAGAERVVVFVNGRHLGDARVLEGIPTADVVAARLRSAEYVRRTDPRFPRAEFDVAIFVDTRAAAAAARTGRVTVSVDAGVEVQSFARDVDGAFSDAGFTQKEVGGERLVDDGSLYPPSVGVTVQYALRGTLGVALAAQHTFEGLGGGYSPQATYSASAGVTSTEAALLATTDIRSLRLSAGPAFRNVRWEWARGFCRCEEKASSSSSAAGLAAEARVSLPLAMRVYPSLRVFARYYPSQEAEYAQLAEPLDVGGLVVTAGLGLSTRF